MKITYIGRCTAGRIIPAGSVAIKAPKNEPVEVPDEIAESLLKNAADWARADEPKQAAKAAKKEV